MKKTILTLIAAMALQLSVADAQIVFQYDGVNNDYASGDAPLKLSDGTTNATETDTTRAFSTNQMSPTAAGYTGPTFFGGWTVSGGTTLRNNSAFPPEVDANVGFLGGGDFIRFNITNTSGVAGDLTAVLLGSLSSTIQLSNLTSITNTVTRGTGTGQSGRSRSLIRIGSNYYVGADNGTNVTGALPSSSLLDTSSWFNFDTSTFAIGSSATLNATDVIDAAGIYVLRTSASTNTGGDNHLNIGEFTVTAIPEPSTFMLLGLGFGALFMVRRCQR